ncbi:large conductance mechanosensitive channel protein MscL [Dehalogenimonas alkenigignens]|uniref:Large-conductance mechanosensitive channel n=1 Tax=Dehalogenimonas alkenigignens TaxID=1217799 RepID=A0A0W0GK38_9CHLR|nr:large conductance mechanosensitive channel protein MscL [Dehalogenimonas alkenigignens]KTB48913.1 large conductance mechanosensitive channel protein [Dehalogenimonas alkenigignens]PVV82759.1 large conductance mechanosensitive channel protein MscL [Dehalogenimonas alkenigignens]
MLKEFKTFIMRGNVVDLAVGIVIGAAFGAIVNSFVSDVLMPPIGLLLGNVDFGNLFVVLKEGATSAPYDSLAAAKAAGAVTINYGVFINALISFLIVAAAIFFFIVRPLNQMAAKQKAKEAAAVSAAPTTKDCPYCATSIPVKAKKCPNCTSGL